jgi:hypothetical protein
MEAIGTSLLVYGDERELSSKERKKANDFHFWFTTSAFIQLLMCRAKLLLMTATSIQSSCVVIVAFGDSERCCQRHSRSAGGLRPGIPRGLACFYCDKGGKELARHNYRTNSILFLREPVPTTSAPFVDT